ncbi:GDSL esterase/lipase At5g45910 [Selaginella moellendorffii]|uniref:GDSL esterase/lipase At5g45910 n=1 Tax=Selaginella moellendorffii TaxID=88036 RepID=UPI000D1CDB00|nr:GDSL esterase/lipase At5g45910 [Selaginella moellendorffii]|eukprot:XP_024540146.1 GDSL esterase/lipase At5g45910 [Selaginella moellendorffii]
MAMVIVSVIAALISLEFTDAGSSSSWELGGFTEKIPAIFQFGDSLSDTGNSLIAFPQAYKRLNTSPYGETFFHGPSGRECDGRLIVDFLASSYGLPLLEPYLRRFKGQDWRHGVSFAACGASALGRSFFHDHNISIGATFQLDIQLQWFREFKTVSAMRSSKRGRRTHPSADDFSQALYIVGEIGGNDYGDMMSTMDYSQMLQFVPMVVQTIRDFIQDLYNLGARKFLVINIPRQGCNPSVILSRRPSDRLDDFGCVADFNALNSRHNSLLRIAVDNLRERLAGASIALADFYGLTGDVLRNPQEYGFTETSKPCCGSPWQNWIVDCVDGLMINGALTMGQTCADPSTHLYWNGLHFTEHLYQVAANAFLKGQYISVSKIGDNVKL